MLLEDLPFQSFFSVEIHLEVKIEIYVPKKLLKQFLLKLLLA